MAARQIPVGGPLLPTGLRRVDAHEDGSTSLYVDTEDHDKQLLRSVGDMLNNHREMADALRAYAEVLDRLDQAERNDDTTEAQALRDEADDLLADIEVGMEWGTPGEGMVVPVSKHDTTTLASALTYAVAERINRENGVVRDLADYQVGVSA